MKTECVYCEVRTEHLKTKLNAVYTLTVMTSGADWWWKCELQGRLCEDMATYWNVERLACVEQDSIPVSTVYIMYTRINMWK